MQFVGIHRMTLLTDDFEAKARFDDDTLGNEPVPASALRTAT